MPSEKRGLFLHMSPDVDALLRTKAKENGVPMSALVDTCVRAFFKAEAPGKVKKPLPVLGIKHARILDRLVSLFSRDMLDPVVEKGYGVRELAKLSGMSRLECERQLYQMQGDGVVEYVSEEWADVGGGRKVRESRWLPKRFKTGREETP